MLTFLLWCILFVLCWPLAIIALVAYPLVWLLLLPFRIVGIAVHGILEIIYLAITLPFRLLARAVSDLRFEKTRWRKNQNLKTKQGNLGGAALSALR